MWRQYQEGLLQRSLAGNEESDEDSEEGSDDDFYFD